MDWFTADTHAYHANIIRYSERPFANVDSMNEALASAINSCVRHGDRLFHLGDFAYRNHKTFRDMLDCANITFIWGNHDKELKKNRPLTAKLFNGCYDILDYKIGDQSIVMCHYAMRVWNKSHHGAWHLYGHSHGSLPDDPNSLSIDVGVDTDLYGHTRFDPYSLDELADIMKQKKFVPLDHHTGRNE